MIYDDEKDLPAKVQSSNLNEELGMVNYVFSDKTGTLTQNIMEFKKFSAGDHSYGSSNPSKGIHYEPGVTNVNFECEKFDEHWTKAIKETGEPLNQKIAEFNKILAICNTIIIEEKNGVLMYNASSPDELALTNGARFFGYEFQERDENSNVVIYNAFTQEKSKYELLNVIEFTSSRKRMSVVVREPNGKIMIYTKGADSIIIPRLKEGQQELIDVTQSFLDEYANEGLRTLLVGQREIDEDEYAKWNKRYVNALCALVNREK